MDDYDGNLGDIIFWFGEGVLVGLDGDILHFFSDELFDFSLLFFSRREEISGVGISADCVELFWSIDAVLDELFPGRIETECRICSTKFLVDSIILDHNLELVILIMEFNNETGSELGEWLAVDTGDSKIEDISDAISGGDIEEWEYVLEVSIVSTHHIPLEGSTLLSSIQSLEVVNEQIGIGNFSIGGTIHIEIPKEIADIRKISIEINC